MIKKNFLELVEIESIEDSGEYVNMVDISVDEDKSFTLSNGIISHNSARSFAVTGFSQTGRDYFGAFPLKGKPLNVRDVPISKIKDNDEIKNIIQVLGLEFGKKYKNTKSLRYGKVVILSDSDCLHGDTIINTIDGNKKIKDLTYSDKVLTHTGKYKEIIKIIKSTKQKHINININGTDFKFGEYHKIPVYRDGIVEFIYAKDILKTDLLLIKK
jgi:hypothetical protein